MESIEHSRYWMDTKQHCYTALLRLAELDETTNVQDDSAEEAMTQILKHGTCYDVAVGLKHYVGFLHASQEIKYMESK